MLDARIVHDAVHSSPSYQDPYGFCPWDSQEERMSVCCSNFDLQISILNCEWNVNWLHIGHGKSTGRNRSELLHLQNKINEIASWMDLKGSKAKNFSWKIGTILKSFLVSSNSCHAFFHLSSDPRWRWIFLKIVCDSPEFNCSIIICGETSMTDEDDLISSTPQYRRVNILHVQHRSKYFTQLEWLVAEESARSRLCGFALAAQVYMIQERCWFSQIDFFVEQFPHQMKILFLSSLCYVIHIHR